MGNAWLAPDTCGVKLGEFEQLAQILSDAASKLERLSGELAVALVQANVDVGPALSVDRIATWARQVGPDLRRRAQLARDMDRKGFAYKLDEPGGTFIVLPDRFQDQLAQLQGQEAAKLLHQAATGDRKALAALATRGYDATTPYFAKALLDAIGANGLLELPAGLAYQLHLDESVDSRHQHLAADAKNVQAVLSTLADALAVGSSPGSGTEGQRLLQQLQVAGRAQHHVPGAGSGDVIYGYQSLATILEAWHNRTQFSLQFFQTVGVDMISFDRQRNLRQPMDVPAIIPFKPGMTASNKFLRSSQNRASSR